MEEIWKDIEGYEGQYQVSNLGRVKSLNYNRTGIEKILQLSLCKNGYYEFKTYKNRWLIHRLVWETFNGHIPEGMQVNHINEDKADNRLFNLNLMTPKENTNWGQARYKQRKPQLISVTQYLLDGTPYFTYFSASDAEKDLGISHSNIIQCCRGNKMHKTAGGYIWKYAKKAG